MHQQILPLQSKEQFDFSNFFITDVNKPVIDYLKNNQTEKMLYLTSKTSSGLTHVLQAVIKLHQKSIYINSINNLVKLADNYTHHKYNAIAIDDIDKFLGNIESETALFNLYNFVAQQNNMYLYLASHQMPALLNCQFPDLKSRLQALLVLTLKELSDEEKMLALEWRAKLRGFTLTRDVSEYLLNHFPRDSQYLFQSLNKLDNLSLEEKRKLTIPFIKEVLF